MLENVRFWLIPKSRVWDAANPGIRNPGIAIPSLGPSAAISAQFTLKMCVTAKNSKKIR